MRLVSIAAVALLAAGVEAQEARTEEGARVAAYAWLRARGEIRDTARVVKDEAELWRRFVVCGGPPERPCTLIGDRPVTIVSFRHAASDSVFVEVSNHFLRTTRCPGSVPLVHALIGATQWLTYTFVHINGKWEQRGIGGVAC